MMESFTAPNPLNGASLQDELSAAGVVMGDRTPTLAGDELELDVAETDRDIVQQVLNAHTGEPPQRHKDRMARDQNLRNAISTLRQWADQAAATTVTSTNNTQITQTMVTRLGVFFDHFADLLEQQYDND